jgi:hypothetical protein
VIRPFSIETIGEYEHLMHKKLVDYRLTGEYFNYPYEEAVILLKNLVESKIIEKEKNKKNDLPLLPMDYFDRVQMLVTEKSKKERINITLQGFLESLQIKYADFFTDRERKISLLEDTVEIAKTLGVTVEYLVTGELEKPDVSSIIQYLELSIEHLRKL